MGDPAVRFDYFRPDHPQLARTLVGRLRARAAKLSDEITEGFCTDWADYKFRLGVVIGLKEAIRECEETDRDMNR